jgi:hypothetical protein
MKIVYAVLAIGILSVPSFAARNRQSGSDVYVGGYQKNDGTYVEPHYRSAPNANKWDNYDYKPSQPQYNAPRENPPSNWNTPNPGRYNDSNTNNDAPSYNYYGR